MHKQTATTIISRPAPLQKPYILGMSYKLWHTIIQTQFIIQSSRLLAKYGLLLQTKLPTDAPLQQLRILTGIVNSLLASPCSSSQQIATSSIIKSIIKSCLPAAPMTVNLIKHYAETFSSAISDAAVVELRQTVQCDSSR